MTTYRLRATLYSQGDDFKETVATSGDDGMAVTETTYEYLKALMKGEAAMELADERDRQGFIAELCHALGWDCDWAPEERLLKAVRQLKEAQE